MQSRLFKNPLFPSLLWIGKNLEIYTAPDQHFKMQMLNLWMSWKSLTVENKVGKSHKRGWSHFKHNINDSGISFLKILRVYQWIGKNIFHWGKSRNERFLHRYIHDNNNKNIYMIIYKKSLKNVYGFLIKLLATTKQL